MVMAKGSKLLVKMTTAVSLILMILTSINTCKAKISPNFYDGSCPDALSTIRTVIRKAVSSERRMAASLIRLHFHDCFVQGCDASILLDEAPFVTSEKTALQNNNSVRGYEIIGRAKSEVEKICPGVVSCADIVAVAARDASFAVGGPSWTVKLGRRDSTTASRSMAERDLPRFTDSLESLLSLFDKKGLNYCKGYGCPIRYVGSHTIGQARCVTFRGRIYSNESDIDAGFASTRRRGCPAQVNNENDGKLAALDLVTPNSFDNNYFKNLIQKKGLLQSDQVLFGGGSTDSIVSEYSNSPSTFKSDFAAAMIKMGDIDPLTGSNGVIRRICNALN